MWCDGGKDRYCHSRDEEENSGRIGVRFVVNASQIKNKNINVAIREIVDPMEETVFQSVYASG